MPVSVYVGNLPYKIERSAVERHFSVCGKVLRVRLIRDQKTGAPRGYGFVDFEDQAAADRALAELGGTKLGGRTLGVRAARHPPSA